jgi:hypothetical protein
VTVEPGGGSDGITSEFPVMRYLANLASVRTDEGTDGITSW